MSKVFIGSGVHQRLCGGARSLPYTNGRATSSHWVTQSWWFYPSIAALRHQPRFMLSPTSTNMGDHSQVTILAYHQANSASYPLLDGKWLPDQIRRSVNGWKTRQIWLTGLLGPAYGTD